MSLIKKESPIKGYNDERDFIETPPVVAFFEKVSYEQFRKDCEELLWDTYIYHQVSDKEAHTRKIYDNIKIPRRKTPGSAGHDFYSPFYFVMTSDIGKENIGAFKSILIPTGIKCKIINGYHLWLVPRSGYGTKHRLQLDNTVGVIDNDYYNNEENEGHIYLKITCDHYNANHKFVISDSEAFAQGVFFAYGVAGNKFDTKERKGGLGSTDLN